MNLEQVETILLRAEEEIATLREKERNSLLSHSGLMRIDKLRERIKILSVLRDALSEL